MNCNDVSRGLIAYLDGNGNSADRCHLEEHLAGCAECRLRAEQFRTLRGVLDDMPVIEPTFAFDTRVRQRVAAEPVRRWYGWFVPQPRLALSAVLLAAMAIWMVKTNLATHQEGPAVAAALQQEGQQEDFNAIKNLDVLENYDVVTSMDALSQLISANVQDTNASQPN